jgi:eukaryotic-like serine/threonine-protein kinase
MSRAHDRIAGRYLLQERVGTGGMGVVWRAHDERLGREVAVKELYRPANLDQAEADVATLRAMREARITARLHHPHAVPVFDVVDHDGQPYLVMQYFPSRSLADLLAEHGSLEPAEVARIGSEVAAALADAHRLDVVHRDVKPANVLIGDDGTAKISDFGIAHALGDASLTSTGMVTGTPAYLAPEAARGEPATPASDVFSLGSTLFAALEGAPPFGTSENPMALLHRVAGGNVLPPQRPGPLTPLLQRMLAKRPQDRPTMAEVADALREPLPGSLEPPAEALVAAPPAVALATAGGPASGDDGGGGGLDALWPPEPAQPDDPTQALGPDEPGPRRSRRPLLVLLALLAAAAAVALGLSLLSDRGAAPTTAQSPSTAATPSDAAPTFSATPSPTPSRPASTSPKPTPTKTTPTKPAPTKTSAAPKPKPTTQAPKPTTPAPAAPAGGAATAGQLEAAVEGYYALLPGDTDAGWSRLTDRYRRTTATSRSYYESFWGAVDSVRVSDVSGRSPGTVTATVRYDYEDGRVYVERTRYRLVEDDGRLKIDQSTVLSSRQL